MTDDFFAPPPPPAEEEPVRSYRPVWAGPPQNIIPAPAPLSVVVAKTEDAAVVVAGVAAYPTGFSFDLHVRVRPGSDADGLIDDPLYVHAHRRRSSGQLQPEQLPPEQLRFGIQFPDGSRATSLGQRWPTGRDELPPQPFLAGGGGGGGENEWHHSWHVWPLPGKGTMAFVCEWPLLRIPLTRAEVDTGPILETAATAVRLWDLPGEGGNHGKGWTGYTPLSWSP
jgi:hypothetical protein